MATLNQFDLPANQTDLQPTQEALLRTEWSNSVNRWTEVALLGDPWDVLNDQNRSFYYNPLTTDIAGGTSAQIAWTAFPNRIKVIFNSASQSDQWGYADGVHTDGTYGPPPAVNGNPYRPVGPRGWQDEYCEWIVTRNEDGKILRIDFTCENPEYYYTLWRINPDVVVDIYRELVDPSVQKEDLYLLDSENKPVIDRSTGLPAYNITNKWNTQPAANTQTGAVHLISPPNTLGAEIYLAAAATLLRKDASGKLITDPTALIECSRYGTPGRNSDPHIGATVNAVVRGGQVKISLQNPVGLYIQMPDFSTFQLPDDPKLPADAQPSDCWKIVRGKENIAGINGNFILHARFELPQAWIEAGVSFTIDDIMIDGNNIQFGAQLTEKFQIALNGLVVAVKTSEHSQACPSSAPKPLPWPQQLEDLNLFQAGTTSTAVTKIEQGQTVGNIVLVTAYSDKNAKIAFSGGGVTASVTSFHDQSTTNNSSQIFVLSITVAADAPLGDRSIQLTNSDGTTGPAAPGMLEIVPPGSLGTTHASAGHPPHALATLAETAPSPNAIDLHSLSHRKVHKRRAHH